MELTSLLLVAVPLAPLAAAAWVVVSYRSERAVNGLALTGALALLIGAAALATQVGATSELPVFAHGEKTFALSMRASLPGLVFLGLSGFLGSIIVRFSHIYMHREPGHARFFGTLLVFLSGLAWVSLAADITTLFLGWEMVGIASFVLVGFYRERVQPTRNALRVFAVYRWCDLGFLAAIAAAHHGAGPLTLGLLLLWAAAGKSAQWPWTYWIPRAMEGPTPSSAVFYGALSVHAGAFLLLQTQSQWEASDAVRWIIAGVGLLTAILASSAGRVQASIKGQVGYASAAQVGLIFVEIALGWSTLALVHLVGNALLRCYQLLISPSVVAYLLRVQSSPSFGHAPSTWAALETLLPRRLQSTLYVFATSEGYLPYLGPTLGRLMRRLRINPLMAGVVAAALASGLCTALLGFESWSGASGGALALMALVVAASSMLLLRQELGASAWIFAALGALGLGAQISLLHGETGVREALPFLLPALVWASLGLMNEGVIGSSRLRWICTLGFIGFPLSPLFFGLDVVMGQALESHPLLGMSLAGFYVLTGVGLVKKTTSRASEPSQALRRSAHLSAAADPLRQSNGDAGALAPSHPHR